MTILFYLGLEGEEIEFSFCSKCQCKDWDIQGGIKSHFKANPMDYNTLAVYDSEYLDLLFPELPSTIHTLEICMDFDDFDLNSVPLSLPSSIKRICIIENEELISPYILKSVADGCRLDFWKVFHCHTKQLTSWDVKKL